MHSYDDYVMDVLMRDLVGHDRKPTAFLLYLWLSAEEARLAGPVQVSYQELAESVGVSKSSAQAGILWLKRRRLVTAGKDSATSVPSYSVHRPWRESTGRSAARRPAQS